MRPVILIALFVLTSSSALGQWDGRGVALIGMTGVCDTTLRIGGGNPAAAAWRSGGAIGVGFLPGLFGLTELRRYGMTGGLTMGGWGGELHLLRYGATLFNESSGWLSVAWMIGTHVSAGISMRYVRWYAKEYAAVEEWGIGAGFLFRDGHTSVGVRARTVGGAFSEAVYELDAGLSVEATRYLLLTAELSQRKAEPVLPRYSIMLGPLPEVRMVLSWQDEPRAIGVGIVLAVSGFDVSYGASRHSVLGWTHGIGVLWAF